jgi:hypothetical protein
VASVTCLHLKCTRETETAGQPAHTLVNVAFGPPNRRTNSRLRLRLCLPVTFNHFWLQLRGD